MNLTSLSTIKHIFQKHHIKPKKGLGQNFLIDKHVIKKLVAAAQLTSDDSVLEVGPGIGTLTRELALSCKKVTAVEKDRTMIEILKDTLADLKNVDLIRGDILDLPVQMLSPYKVVANLPYYITAPAIRKFLESQSQPETMTLLVQKEVAQRICAKPPRMNILAVSVQFYARPKVISYIKRTSFWPKPRVDSALLHIVPTGNIPANPTTFFSIVKAGFRQPRKYLLNNLSNGLKTDKTEIEKWLSKNSIKPTQRAETLSLQDWINLANTFSLLSSV